MAFDSIYIESFQTKHRSSVGFTSTAKEVSNEANALINPHAVNAAQIPIIDVVEEYGPLVASGIAAAVVQKHTVKLTADPTVNDNKAWYADESDCIEIGHTDTGRIVNIMRVAGTQYKLRLFEDNGAGTGIGTEIFDTEANFNWDYDAAACTIYMDDDPDPSKVLPLWAEVYVYIGETVSDKLDTTSSGSVGENYYTKVQTDALLSSNSSTDQAYADAGDTSTLSSAQGYADSGDTATLGAAQSYADAGDVATLSGAQSYTDTQLALQDTFVEMTDTPSSYSDTSLVLSTGSAIVYTSDLTWNDTSNALTITSGTFGFSDAGTTINEISTDGNFADNSDDAVPTEAAVKTYVDTSISTGTDALDFYKTISDGVDSFDADGNDDTLTFNGAGGIIVSAASGTQTVTISGAADFIGLTDTPASYISSNAGYMLRVNDAYDGVDFASTIITDAAGNTTIYGDLSVSGTVFYVDHETVQVSDNMITVNYGEVGVGVTNVYGGIEVDRGTLENYWFVFDETDDWFKIGTSGTLQPVATRGSSLTDTYIPFGNDDSSYTESADFTYNDTTKALDINGSVVLSAGTSVNEFSTDTTLSGNSDDAVPTEKAVKTYIDAGDAATLSSANGYTDTQLALQDTFVEMTDTPSSYNNTSLVMSTAGAIEYTTDITWDDTSNALIITSGTLTIDTAAGANSVNEFSTDGTLAGNSNDALPTEAAVKTYVDGEVTTLSGALQANIDAHDEFIELTDTPDTYVAQKVLYTTASGVEFSDALTWNESTDAMTIGGTLGLASGTTVNEFSTDTTLSGNSDDAVPTEAAVKTYVDAGDAATLASAQGYADSGDASTLSSAQGYADSGDTATLGAAQTYADAGDVATLSGANSYTDTQLALQDTFVEMNDTPAGYDDTKLVMSTAGAIVYTSDITWNDSTNALTITSGTFGFSDAGTTINEISTDTTLAGDSDDAVPTEKAVKAYVDTVAAAQSEFIELSDTPAAYIAQKMLYTSASGVEFANELTWDGSLMTISGSMTLASGTSVDEISADITMADNSPTALVTESAVKGYVDAEIIGQQSYSANMTISGSVWTYNGGFTTVPDNLVIYLNGVRNKSNDSDYYSADVNGGILEITFAYDTYAEDWVVATYGSVQGGMYVTRWQSKIANYQSANGDRIMVDTSATGSNSVAYTITLPANPTIGDVVYIFDAGGNCATTNVTVGRNGSNIMGAAADMDIDVDEASVELVYYSASGGWRLV